MKHKAIKAFEESADVKRRFVQEYADKIAQAAQLLTRALREGH